MCWHSVYLNSLLCKVQSGRMWRATWEHAVSADWSLDEHAPATVAAAHGALVKAFIRLDQSVAADRLHEPETQSLLTSPFLQWRKSGWNSGGRTVDPQGLVGASVGVWEGGTPFHGERVWAQKKNEFLAWNSVFRCILSGTLLSVSLPEKCWIYRLKWWFRGH